MPAAAAPDRRGGTGRLGSVLELTRVFLAPGAMADSYAGLVLVSLESDASPTAGTFVGTALTSVCLYAFGMVSNDLLDLRKDRREAPGRPLPSGRVSTSSAVLLAGALLGAALFPFIYHLVARKAL